MKSIFNELFSAIMIDAAALSQLRKSDLERKRERKMKYHAKQMAKRERHAYSILRPNE